MWKIHQIYLDPGNPGGFSIWSNWAVQESMFRPLFGTYCQQRCCHLHHQRSRDAHLSTANDEQLVKDSLRREEVNNDVSRFCLVLSYTVYFVFRIMAFRFRSVANLKVIDVGRLTHVTRIYGEQAQRTVKVSDSYGNQVAIYFNGPDVCHAEHFQVGKVRNSPSIVTFVVPFRIVLNGLLFRQSLIISISFSSTTSSVWS